MAAIPEQGGRFDFDDGGAYIGDWQDGRAHGLGVCTGPRGQGEYAGEWVSGFESCGVYIWPSGNTYSGTWTKGKRHGEGIEAKGRWVYRGEWTTGFKGRYGVREATNTCARYEGTWAAGLQDGSGVETYSDGGTYAGQWQQGTRHGFGVRQSVPYGLASRHGNPRALRESLTSVRSIDEPDTQVKENERKLDEGRSGFVLHGHSFHYGKAATHRRMTLSNRHRNWRRNFALKFRRPFSTGDIETSPSLGAGDSLRSTSVTSHAGETHSLLVSTTSELTAEAAYNVMDPDITEIYRGEWRNDKRSGFGVCERSDGLRYEGEWYNNKRFGYGVTTFPDKSREEGKYRDNVLISTYKKSRFVQLRPGRLRERIELALREARRAAYMAMQKADVARQRQSQAKEKAVASEFVSKESHQLAEKARAVALRYVPNFRLKSTQVKEPPPGMRDAGPAKSSNRKSLRKLRKQDSVVQDDYVPGAHHDLFLHSDAGFEAAARGGSLRADFRCSHFEADPPRKDFSPPSPRDLAYPAPHPHPLPAHSPDLPNKRQLRDRAARHSPVAHSALSNYHYDQYSAPISKRDSGLGRDSSLEESVPSSSGLGALARWESDTPDSGMSDVSQRSRRRAQPFLTYPPVEVGYSSAEEDAGQDAAARLTVIIEDGVRKVVPCLDEEDLRTPTAHAGAEFAFPEEAPAPRPEDPGVRHPRLRRHHAQDDAAGPAAKESLLEDPRSDKGRDPRKHDPPSSESSPRPTNVFNLIGMVAVAVSQHWIHALRSVSVFHTIRSVKNWFVKNLVVLLVLAVNSVLAFLFFRLLNTNRS